MGMIRISGQLICADTAEAALVTAHLPAHVAATRAEAGCLSFEVTQAGPRVWDVAETFADRTAFDAHQARAATSPWAAATAGIRRAYTITEEPADGV